MSERPSFITPTRPDYNSAERYRVALAEETMRVNSYGLSKDHVLGVFQGIQARMNGLSDAVLIFEWLERGAQLPAAELLGAFGAPAGRTDKMLDEFSGSWTVQVQRQERDGEMVDVFYFQPYY